MKLKPIPKLILILVVVGAVGYGANELLGRAPKTVFAPTVQPQQAQQEQQQVAQPAEVQEQPVAQQAQPQPTEVQEQPAQQDNGQNAGLSKLLNGKKDQ
jgi:hypothetical protein